MSNSLKVSIIIPTRDRPKDLAELLLTVLDQDYPPLEVIIVDDSDECTAKQVADLFKSNFKRIDCRFKYVKGSSDGLPAARNIGVKVSRGDAILFLDDDTLLDKNTVRELATFLENNPKALGVQPKILSSTLNMRKDGLPVTFENSVYKALMLTYRAKNKQAVRRSGMSIFPNDLTEAINVQRLSGCCCIKREVFKSLKFDENLKRWGFMEDLDFSYRLYKKYPQSLYAVPNAKVIHKRSVEGRLPSRLSIHMTNIYWFYVFFKDVFEGSMLNLMAFLWALLGNLVSTIGGLVIKRKAKHEWWRLIYLLESYAIALKNLKAILSLKLDFFNKKLVRQVNQCD